MRLLFHAEILVIKSFYLREEIIVGVGELLYDSEVLSSLWATRILRDSLLQQNANTFVWFFENI